ncbi:MAG: thioredoxin-disulfide reductase [Clostridia bacterium]|nr:thioredoxin-disulfide reductase [Clostridia bacterium]
MDGNVIVSDVSRFEEDVLKSSMPVSVYFYSDDCLPCINFSPIYERAAQSLKGEMKFVKVFRSHNRQLAERYSVKSSPTVLFFKDGTEVCTRLSGYITHPDFKSSIEKILGRACGVKNRTVARCDVLIIGAGPAGLTSAIYTARSRLYTIVIDSSLPGGQVASTFHIANYPGTNGVVRGIDLMENMKKQALDFGAQIDDMQRIIEVSMESDEKHVKTDQADYHAKSIIIAAGAQPRKLPADGEADYRGRGVHYCATCDGAMYMDADILVVGGGTSALEEALFLTRYAKTVTIINRSDSFKAARSYIDEAMKNPQISIIYNTIVKKIIGDGFVQGAELENQKTGEVTEIKTEGIFVYIGNEPNSAAFRGLINLSSDGYIITDCNMATNIKGVFAAGDIRDKEVRQITTAVGDGTIAGIMAEKYVNGR